MAWLVLIEALAASALALAAGTACGQSMSDPTRPPAAFHLGSGHARSGDAAGGLVLQSVLIFPDARSAIISGEHVLLGQKIGGQRLVKVGEAEVVLLNGASRRTLKLFPSADKRSSMTTRGTENSKQ
jgi:MSHA biogenesis protein MshK